MDTEKQRQVWTPIKFSEKWVEATTAKFDDLAPSWFKRRETLTERDDDYKEFLERLKRQHAIETGIVEKLYDLSEGITQTFIKEGFIDSYVGHDDTNIAPRQLMAYLNDHFEALDFVFAVVRSHRELSNGFIKELHALLTKHQKTTPAVDGLGKTMHMELRKGEFKKHPNNPRREDGAMCLYCPPEQVESEMENLLNIYEERLTTVNPIVVSAWFHHAFTQIHPFQDGNGRMARLLSSLIWIKEGLFPLTVKRTEKSTYIGALEKADAGDPNQLVAFFSEAQSKSIDSFLNYKMEAKPGATLAEVAAVFGEKVGELKLKQEQERQKLLVGNRQKLFDGVYEVFGRLKDELVEALRERRDIDIFLKSVESNSKDAHWYTKQIIDYASNHDYYFNRLLPRFWFRFSFKIAKEKRYDLIATIHHSSYDDSVMAIGAFLEFFDETAMDEEREHTDYASSIPIDVEPYKISLERITPKLLQNIESYVRDVVTIGLTVITSQIG